MNQKVGPASNCTHVWRITVCLLVAACAAMGVWADDVYLLRDDAKVNNVDVRSFEAAGNWSNAVWSVW